MKVPDLINRFFQTPRLTKTRMGLALVVAAGADGLQMLLAQFGWLGFDQIIDLITMLILSRIIGFHLLFLPTFLVELVPLVEDLPTWTACTAAVLALRKRDQRNEPVAVTTEPKPLPPRSP